MNLITIPKRKDNGGGITLLEANKKLLGFTSGRSYDYKTTEECLYDILNQLTPEDEEIFIGVIMSSVMLSTLGKISCL